MYAGGGVAVWILGQSFSGPHPAATGGREVRRSTRNPGHMAQCEALAGGRGLVLRRPPARHAPRRRRRSQFDRQSKVQMVLRRPRPRAQAAARTARPAAGRRPSPRCSPVFPRAGLAASSGPPRPGAASANPPWLLPGARARSRRARGAKPACLAFRRSPLPLGPGRDRGAQLLRGLLAHIGRAGARSPRSLPRVKADGRQTASGQGGRRRARGRG